MICFYYEHDGEYTVLFYRKEINLRNLIESYWFVEPWEFGQIMGGN